MNANAKLLLLMTMLFVGFGCAKENSGGSPAPSGPAATCDRNGACTTPTPTTGPTPPVGATPPPGYDSGSSAELKIVGTSTLAQLFYSSNPNSPTNIRVNIDLNRQSESVIISYQENGRTYEAALGTTHPNSGVSNAMHNGWVNQDGKTIWKGMFQDRYGAVVLIVDKFLSQGDGQAGNILGGSIWFQNFNRYSPNFGTQGPLKMCWEIEMGPYDCRTYLVGNYVNMISAYYPNNRGPDANMSYTKLGDFNGISRTAAGF